MNSLTSSTSSNSIFTSNTSNTGTSANGTNANNTPNVPGPPKDLNKVCTISDQLNFVMKIRFSFVFLFFLFSEFC